MSSSRESSQTRIPSLLSLGSTASSVKSDEELDRPGLRSLRPIPRSRDASPRSQGRYPSAEMLASRGRPLKTQDARSRVPSPTSVSVMHASPSLQNLYQTHSLGWSPALLSQSLDGLPASGRRPSGPSGFHHGEPLLPPPAIGATFAERSSSPTGSSTRGRPDSRAGSQQDSRNSSPAKPYDFFRPSTPTEGSPTRKKIWMPGRSHYRSESEGTIHTRPLAWVVTPQRNTPYDVSGLIRSQPISELWDNSGNVYVHLFPHGSGCGPSFRISSSVIASSRILRMIAYEKSSTEMPRKTSGQNGQQKVPFLHSHMRQLSLDAQGPLQSTRSRPRSSTITSSESSSEGSLGSISDFGDEPCREVHLYMPIGIVPGTETIGLSSDDLEVLVATRNLFAFLVGQVLVGTPKSPSIFAVFLSVATLLKRYEFTNLDRSTFGEVATANFIGYVRDLSLDDVRNSRTKTLEAIILGERMKSRCIYNEAFVHAAGKWSDLVDFNDQLFGVISDTTRNRLEKASMDLAIRLKSMQTRLEEFDYPSLFAGIANSSSAGKTIDFKTWKSSFFAMRKHTMTIYKNKYGSWPPKANSKKHDFEESGLNRVLLKELYRDLSDLYDMLVDRASFTTRSADTSFDQAALSTDPKINALRKLLGEFDSSSPPVQPPVPFDTPLMPDLSTTRRDYRSLSPKKQAKERAKRLKDDDINMALMQSYNRDSVKITPFLEQFMAYERNAAHGRSIEEMADVRIGQWIFLYVVLQSLPMVVVDAPDLRWSQGTEYFLCEVPKGSPPWVNEEGGRKKAYYRIAGGSGVVSLPADIVDHGVEGIYRRSHCWQMADRWISYEKREAEAQAQAALLYAEIEPPSSDAPTGQEFVLPPISCNGLMSPLPLPPVIDPDCRRRSRSVSPQGMRNRKISIAPGLEALPLPDGIVPESFSPNLRKVSTPNAAKSFADILGPSVPVKKRW